MNRTVVYTSLISDERGGGALPSVARPEEGVDYLCLTRLTEGAPLPAGHGPWRFVDIGSDTPANTLQVAVKILPHCFLPQGYDVSIYVEGVDVVGPMRSLVDVGLGDQTLALYEHPFRDSLLQEFEVCIESGQVPWRTAVHQYQAYRRAGFDDSARLHESAILLRRHNHPDLIRFARWWWYLFLAGIPQDQLSFGFAQWLTGLQPKSLGRSDPRYDKKYFSYRAGISVRRTEPAPPPGFSRAIRASLNRTSLRLMRMMGRDPMAIDQWVVPPDLCLSPSSVCDHPLVDVQAEAESPSS